MKDDTITWEDILAAKKLLDEHDTPWPRPMIEFAGIPIISNPYMPDLVPVIQLSENVMVSDAFREKCNKFYIDMFGYKTPIVWKTDYGLMMGPKLTTFLVDTGV